jgi:hypothetical protein
MTETTKTKFIIPNTFDLKKQIRNLECINKLKMRAEEDILPWLNDRQQNSIDRKAELEKILLEKEKEIKQLQKDSTSLKRKLANAEQWILNPDRNKDKDQKCLKFQSTAKNLIEKIDDDLIPLLEKNILKTKFKGAIEFHEKYILNQPTQVMQRIKNDATNTVNNVEKILNDFSTVKGKETQLNKLRSKLNISNLNIRIENIENAIKFRATVDKNPQGVYSSKQIDEYWTNELNEMEFICKDAFVDYIERIYFKQGIEAFYQKLI